MSATPQHENPLGTDGFEFVEFCAPIQNKLEKDFENLGFVAVAKHKSKAITLYKQGDIHFLVNHEIKGHAVEFGKLHGPSACAMAFRVKDAKAAHQVALKKGAKDGSGSLDLPAIVGIGGSLLYFVDRYANNSIYKDDFDFFTPAPAASHVGLTYLDHLTHNVRRGEMDTWTRFYQDLFNFREIRYFDIKGKVTGLFSRALTSPCNKIRIPINESSDDQSQIEEFITEFKGEGIQHIALGTDDICHSVDALRQRHIKFLDVPDTYYDAINDRVPWHTEDLLRLKQSTILIDGAPVKEGGLLLQLFTENMLGPIFFEIIQRKGNDGFGEGNFQALFEAIERDQIRRGVIKV